MNPDSNQGSNSGNISDSGTTPDHEPSPPGTTAIVILPPHDIQGYANHYRNLYMPDDVHRIEPHITVLYPFVPYNKLEEAMPRLQQALAACAPTYLSIRGFATFPEEGILYLYLAKPERVHALYRAILAEFPQYPAYGGKHGDEFVPHITVGEFSKPAELKMVYEELSGQHLYIGWDVEQVVVKVKAEDGVWYTCAELPLLGEAEGC